MEVSSDQVQSTWIEATVIRADGTVEAFGVVDSYTRGALHTVTRSLPGESTGVDVIEITGQ